MQNLNMKLPTLKEIEATFFRKLQEQFMDVMVSYFEKLDEWIMASRDTRRFRMHENREVRLENSGIAAIGYDNRFSKSSWQRYKNVTNLCHAIQAEFAHLKT